MDNENQTTPGDRPTKPFAEPSGSVTDTELFRSAEKLHLYISVMLKDWKDGDFALPRLAEIHMEQIREGYRALGKALNAELSRPAAHRVLHQSFDGSADCRVFSGIVLLLGLCLQFLNLKPEVGFILVLKFLDNLRCGIRTRNRKNYGEDDYDFVLGFQLVPTDGLAEPLRKLLPHVGASVQQLHLHHVSIGDGFVEYSYDMEVGDGSIDGLADIIAKALNCKKPNAVRRYSANTKLTAQVSGKDSDV